MSPATIEKGVVIFLSILTLLISCLLLVILITVFVKGLPALHTGFFIEASKDFGRSGGIFYQILGTLILMTGAVLISLPVALGSVIYQTQYLKSKRFKEICRQSAQMLNATPTILFGLVGYLFFGVYLDTGVSWMTGVLILSVMILPTLQISIREAVEAIPEQYKDAGMALGLSQWHQVKTIIIPHCYYGIITGVFLGLARAAGETAAIMFTATTFSGIDLPVTFSDPVPTLQTHMLVLTQEAANPQAVAQAWGAGWVLLSIVFFLTLAAGVLRSRLKMEADL
ncbi:MAG: phosphate ABC transporter permease PstA [Nitrospinae bacterium]|nr:phosphate ABC transporter permease PstA [Nitrospinota bacterium]